MIDTKIKYAFNQFETALIAFCGNIQLKLQNIVSNLPVFLLNNGDFSYFVEKKFVQTNNEEVYLKTPRFVIKIDDFQLNSEEDTNQYNKIVYTFEDSDGPRNYQAVVRRKAYNIQITGYFVSPNLIVAMNNMEVMATLMSRDNVFTYEFLGNTIQSAYRINQSSHELPNIDMGQGGTRNVSVSYQIELQVHLIVPRVESIILEDDTGFDEINFYLKTEPDGDYDIHQRHVYEDLRKEENQPSPSGLYQSGSLFPQNTKFK